MEGLRPAFGVIAIPSRLSYAPDPFALLARMRGLLAKGGVCAANVPNALTVSTERGDAHLLTIGGIRELLSRAGLDYVELQDRWGDGRELSLLASADPLPHAAAGEPDYPAYFARLAGIGNIHFAIGGAYRLLRWHVHHGDWPRAMAARDTLMEVLRTFGVSLCDQPASAAAWREQRGPFCLAGIHYFLGHIALNAEADFPAAEERLQASVQALRRMAASGVLTNEQRQYFWEALYHAALTRKHRGRAFDDLLAQCSTPSHADAASFGAPSGELRSRLQALYF